MVAKVLMRTFGIILLGLLLMVRACFFAGAVHHLRRSAASAESDETTTSEPDYRNAVPLTATDNYSWILFNSTDPKTGALVRHSRLTAASGVVVDGQAGPPNVLELLAQGRDERHIRLTLQTPAACPGITSLHASFGSHPTTIAVKPLGDQPACTVEMLDYAGILQSLRDADVMTVRAGDGPEVRFAVTGLSWD